MTGAEGTSPSHNCDMPPSRDISKDRYGRPSSYPMPKGLGPRSNTPHPSVTKGQRYEHSFRMKDYDRTKPMDFDPMMATLTKEHLTNPAKQIQFNVIFNTIVKVAAAGVPPSLSYEVVGRAHMLDEMTKQAILKNPASFYNAISLPNIVDLIAQHYNQGILPIIQPANAPIPTTTNNNTDSMIDIDTDLVGDFDEANMDEEEGPNTTLIQFAD